MVRASEALAGGVSGPIVFVAADRRECEPWVARWSAVERVRIPVQWARRGEWRGRRMFALANGAGADRAYAAAKIIGDAIQIWNIGFAGAADPTLGVGAVVVATCVRSGAAGFRCEPPRACGRFQSGVVMTVPEVVQSARKKSEYYAGGASVVEMEAAGAARAATESGVPFYCVRVVSDPAEEDFVNDYNRALGLDGRFSALRLFCDALASPPARFRELIRLGKRTALAARNLGDFLADCEF